MVRFIIFALSLAVVGGSGCAPVRDYPAPNVPCSVRLLDVETARSSRPYSAARIASVVSSVPCKPSHVLVLSGGAMNGAYPAGILKGWSESGQRPEFDVVTGVSTGSLIALFAFLGSEYDAALERCYTGIQASDIYRRRSLMALPWADSLADSEPLRRRIETEVTPQVLAKVAQAHRAGRRLYAGTTNLDTTQSVVWDLGAIAAGNAADKLELFRKVLLASCSLPGFLPPVPIDIDIDGKHFTELHVDGGVSTAMFLHPYMLGLGPNVAPAANCTSGTVYAIVAGKLHPDPVPVRRRLFQVSESSLRGVFQSQMEGDLLRIYLLSLYGGMKFALTGVPQNFAEEKHSMAFDPKVMGQLFAEGRRFGRTGDSWQTLPPGLDPRQRQMPRKGVVFTARDAQSGLAAPSIQPGGNAALGSRLRAWVRQKGFEVFHPATEPLSVNAPAAQ